MALLRLEALQKAYRTPKSQKTCSGSPRRFLLNPYVSRASSQPLLSGLNQNRAVSCQSAPRPHQHFVPPSWEPRDSPASPRETTTSSSPSNAHQGSDEGHTTGQTPKARGFFLPSLPSESALSGFIRSTAGFPGTCTISKESAFLLCWQPTFSLRDLKDLQIQSLVTTFLFPSFYLPSLMAFTKGKRTFFFPCTLSKERKRFRFLVFSLQPPAPGRHQRLIFSSPDSWGYHWELTARDGDSCLNRFK